jgi:hypothetical protein
MIIIAEWRGAIHAAPFSWSEVVLDRTVRPDDLNRSDTIDGFRERINEANC